MGKASSAKKVARVARAGGGRRSGQRRALGFPFAIVAVLVLGSSLVIFARNERNANASPRAGVDHWHEAYSVYTCVTDPSTPASSTTTTTASSTTTTAPASDSGSTTTSSAPATTTTTAPTTTASTTPTTVANPGDPPGQFQPFLNTGARDVLGIHTHDDGVIHIEPMVDSVAGRKATLGKFLDYVGASITDTTLSFATPAGGKLEFKENTTKCQGGRDGEVQVARWDSAKSAANGDKPNEIITSNMGSILLKDGQALTISFMPAGTKIPIQSDVEKRIEANSATTTTAPAGSGATTTTAPASSVSSTAPSTAPATTASASSSSSSS